MVFSMRFWSVCISCCLAACSPPRDHGASIHSALVRDSGKVLDLRLSLSFSPVMLQALDHGIPLVLNFHVDPDRGQLQHQSIHLHYLPLARRYEYRVGESPVQTFQSRLQMLAALDQARFVLTAPIQGPGEVWVTLDAQSLPAPLRLSALLDSEWRLRSVATPWKISA